MEKSDHVEAKGAAKVRSNGFAIAGLTLGILSIFTASLGIAPILAVIFSSIGLSKVRGTGRGKIQSWIGLVLGILYFFVFLYHKRLFQ